jgi:zinc/manganese transport system ATP-binding protein
MVAEDNELSQNRPRVVKSPGRAASPPAVALRQAGVRLGGHFIWRGVDLTVEVGQFLAILGPNGAGKSTLLKSLLGIVPLAEGTAEVFGKPVHRGSDEVGYLPQRRRFDADLRIRALDLVRLGLDGAHWGLPVPAWVPSSKAHRNAARVEEVIRLVGAESYAKRPIGELSGGEQQRVLIAQALVAGARMLALDEPLDSLDLNNQQAISALIRDICQQQHVTVLLVAHDVNPLLPFLDRVVYVANGNVLSGEPDEVIRTETLTRLYGAPVEVLKTSDGRLVVVGQHDEGVSYHPHGHTH